VDHADRADLPEPGREGRDLRDFVKIKHVGLGAENDFPEIQTLRLIVRIESAA
jgi:hypothetical protein